MTQDLFLSIGPILLIGIIGLVVGSVFGGLLVSSLRGQNDKSGTPDSPSDKNLLSAIRIWRDRQNGKLIIEYEGEQFRSASKLTAGQRNAVSILSDEIKFWLNPQDASGRVTAGQVTGSEPLQPVKAQAGTFSAIDSNLPAEMELAESPNNAYKMAAGATAVAVSTKDSKTKESVKEPPKSIVEEIDEILQKKIPQTNLNHRNIRLIELPDRGMVVMVDGKSFEGVGDVPDPEVRQVIQACVAEWEKSR